MQIPRTKYSMTDNVLSMFIIIHLSVLGVATLAIAERGREDTLPPTSLGRINVYICNTGSSRSAAVLLAV